MKLQKAVGLRICNLLIKHKISRYQLCKKINLSEQALKHIIDERNKDIKLSTIAAIADGFDMSLEEFFADALFNKKDLEIY